jgi:hypothetical protein
MVLANVSRDRGPAKTFDPYADVISRIDAKSAAEAAVSRWSRTSAVFSGGLTARTRPIVIGHHQTPS